MDSYNEDFWKALDELVSNSEIVIDRPRGSAHPRFPNFIYKVDYGYLKNTSSMDGAGIDEVHVLISQTVFMRTIMKTVLCENTEWLLSEEAFSIYASCMYHPTYEEYKAQMEDYLHDSSVKVFVCENRGKRIGMMVLKSSGVAAEIIGIAVSDNARHKGIGKELIQSVIKSEEIERIKAQTDDGSIGFYRKCGFSEEKTVVEYSDGSAVRYNCVLYK